MSYRCCMHCADDPVHDVEKDGHSVPCGGRYGPCSDGGDELTPDPPSIDLTYDDQCSGCDWECTCG